jgi:hypothetical protein
MGELVVHDSKSSVQTTTDLQAFALLVTAEPYFAVTQPSDLLGCVRAAVRCSLDLGT